MYSYYVTVYHAEVADMIRGATKGLIVDFVTDIWAYRAKV
jgi:hypothetical protein